MNRQGQELKTNVTDPQSAKLVTSKGVIQGYAAQAAVDSAHQIITAADVIGSGSEQAMLLPMIEQVTPYQAYTAQAADCQTCALRAQGLKGPLKPNYGRGRQVSRFEPKPKDPANPSERMRQAIDSPRGRQLYSQRFGTVEPVFGNIRHNKRLTRLNHRGHTKVNTQGNLYCRVHNIEKLSQTGLGQQKGK